MFAANYFVWITRLNFEIYQKEPSLIALNDPMDHKCKMDLKNAHAPSHSLIVYEECSDKQYHLKERVQIRFRIRS